MITGLKMGDEEIKKILVRKRITDLRFNAPAARSREIRKLMDVEKLTPMIFEIDNRLNPEHPLAEELYVIVRFEIPRNGSAFLRYFCGEVRMPGSPPAHNIFGEFDSRAMLGHLYI